MKLAEGVDLHLIKREYFQTNHLTFRFSTNRHSKNIARRSLVAQMLATANEKYPTSRDLRIYLASLYGASFSTSIRARGPVHIVDIDIVFINNQLALQNEDIIEKILSLLYTVLFKPLISLEKYQTHTFEIEQKNLIRYMEIDNDDPFYISEEGLRQLYFYQEEMRLSKFSNIDLIEKENAFTAYQEFQRMLREDKIDIFIVGDFDDYQVIRSLTQFSFRDRQVELKKYYQQDISKIVKEKVVLRPFQQSILQLGYHIPFVFDDFEYYVLLVVDGLLGGFSHSKLFTAIREKESLAYTIGSRFDIYSGLFNVYVGIDRVNRNRVFKLINNQINELKMGRFSTQLVKQTKQMLINNARASLDNPKSIIEQEYSRQLYSNDYTLDYFIEQIEKVTKKDIISVVNVLKLQAVYFLEGE